MKRVIVKTAEGVQIEKLEGPETDLQAWVLKASVAWPKGHQVVWQDITDEVVAIEAKEAAKQAARERIKAWKKENLDSATTIAGLRSQVKDLFADVVEILK